MCPYLVAFNGRIVKLHDCDLAQGRCYAYCPRTELDLPALQRERFGSVQVPLELGVVRAMLMARARDPQLRERAQTAGVVSALVALALEEKLVDAAILTQRGRDLLPSGRKVTSREEVLQCAGSSYVASPTLAALNRGPWTAGERVAVVGLPCQVLALAKIRADLRDRTRPAPELVMTIGLFCTWALSHAPFLAFLRGRLGSEPILGMDISPPPERILRVRTRQGTRDIPVDEIRGFIQPTCSLCADMTSELADVSVGTVEGEPGWNTLILRTQAGESLLERAKDKGILEVKEMDQEHAANLAQASMLKKRRALARLRETGALDNGHLVVEPGWVERLIQGNEGGEL